MMILTGRLEALAKQIKPGETMADIGTDHGFLPISLFLRGTCPKVIMTDVSPKALSRATAHGKDVFGLSEDDFRAGDGLSPISPGEVDVVVLAGMGGILMTSILAADLAKAKTIRKFIFQPRNHPEMLRYWLGQNGFVIISESLVRERHNLCEIIVAEPAQTIQLKGLTSQPSWPSTDICWEIPTTYAQMADPLALEYLHKKLERERRVRRGVQKGQNPDAARMAELDDRIAYLRSLIEKRESNDKV